MLYLFCLNAIFVLLSTLTKIIAFVQKCLRYSLIFFFLKLYQQMEHLQSFIKDCDRKIQIAKKRLEETQDDHDLVPEVCMFSLPWPHNNFKALDYIVTIIWCNTDRCIMQQTSGERHITCSQWGKLWMLPCTCTSLAERTGNSVRTIWLAYLVILQDFIHVHVYCT